MNWSNMSHAKNFARGPGKNHCLQHPYSTIIRLFAPIAFQMCGLTLQDEGTENQEEIQSSSDEEPVEKLRDTGNNTTSDFEPTPQW